MTVSLDLSLDVSAVPAHPGGAGYYTMALARGLASHPHVALTLVARRGDCARWHELASGTPCHDAVPTSRHGVPSVRSCQRPVSPRRATSVSATCG